MRNIDLPEIGQQAEQPEPRPFNMPRKNSPAATGCAVIAVAWFICMGMLLLVALTGGVARLAFWAVGA